MDIYSRVRAKLRHLIQKLIPQKPESKVADALTSSLSSMERMEKKSYALFVRRWGERVAQQPHLDEQTAQSLRNLFDVATRPDFCRAFRAHPVYDSEVVAVSDDLADTCLNLGDDRPDCCVVFKKALDSKGDMLAACNHGVLGVSDMIKHAKQHPELKGTTQGEAHILFLSPFAKHA